MTKFDAIRYKARELQNQTSPYGVKGVYGALDGAVNAYSAVKSYFDYAHSTESQIASFDAMHEWISTPIGLAATLSSSLFFMIVANHANIKEKSKIGRAWKVSREGAQASRNAFKGFRSTILTAELFSPRNLHYLILPTSLGLGGLYVINRIIMLHVNDARKDIIKKNNEVFEHIMNYGTFLECAHSATQAQLTKDAKNYLKKCIYLKDEKKFIYITEVDGKIKQTPIENKYILYKEPGQEEQLHFVDPKGQAQIVERANIAALREVLAKNKNALHLSLLQLNELLPPGVAQQHFNLLKKEKIEPRLLLKGTSYNNNAAYYMLKAYNGLVDGLYLYISIISLVPLCPQALIFAIALSVLYCLLCVVHRTYEEYQTQQNVRVSEYKIMLAAAGKELELRLIELNEIAIRIEQETDTHKIENLKAQQKAADEALDKQLKIFESARKTLRKENKVTNLTSVLLGIKHGLPFYGALISAMFAAAFICFLCSTPIAPALVLATIASGIPIILGAIAHAFLTRKKPEPDETPADAKNNVANLGKRVADVKASFKLTRKDTKETQEADLIRARAKNSFIDWITISIQADALLDTYYSDGAEVFRSFCAGLLKGKKEIEFLFNRMQEPDAQGHYQDTTMMYFIIVPFAIIYALAFALKAFAKGLSRTLNNQEDFSKLVINDLSSFGEKSAQKEALDASKSEEITGTRFHQTSNKLISTCPENKKTLTLDLSNNTNNHISIKISPPSPIKAADDIEPVQHDTKKPQIYVRTGNSKIEINISKGLTTYSMFSRATHPESESPHASSKKLKITHSKRAPSPTQHPVAIEGSDFYHCTF